MKSVEPPVIVVPSRVSKEEVDDGKTQVTVFSARKLEPLKTSLRFKIPCYWWRDMQKENGLISFSMEYLALAIHNAHNLTRSSSTMVLSPPFPPCTLRMALACYADVLSSPKRVCFGSDAQISLPM